MIKVGVGFSEEKDQIAAAKEAVRHARMGIAGEKISLAMVFSTIDFAHTSLLKTLSVYMEGVPLIGCSGAAVISKKGIYKHGLIVMLFSLPAEVYFNVASVKDIKAKTPQAAGEELGEKLLYGFQNVRRDVGIILSDGLMEESSNLVYGLQDKLGKSFPIVGGCASDNLAFKKTYVYSNEEMMSDAACGIVLGGKLNFGIGVKHGWKPLGKPRRITRSTGNVVYEIDGVAAANIYEEYLASDAQQLRKELKRISILYPLGVYLPGEEEYLLRNLVSIQEDGSLVLLGNVPQDSLTRLMIGTKESCLEATKQAIEEVNRGLFGRKINFVLVFDSISRYILLGRQAEKELNIIRESLNPDAEIIGVYTYGEQAPLMAINYQGRTYSHNQTVTVLGVAG